MQQPLNLDRIVESDGPGLARFQALSAYLTQGEKKLRRARALRDECLRHLAAEHGKAETARMTGVSVSTVKIAAR